MKKKKLVSITWWDYSSRAESIANVLGAELIFIGNARKKKNMFVSFILYFSYTYQNIKALLKLRPDILIITNTTWVVALVNFFYAKITGIKLVLDSHSCAFDHVFIKYPLFVSKFFAKHSTLSFVTNKTHYNLISEKGGKALILSDIPFEDKFRKIEKIRLSNKFNICYICTFSYDEPYCELIEAAKQLDDIQIYITGNYVMANINPNDYKHVIFTGYLENEKYRSLLKSVNAVITLTRNEDTMQRAGSEAVSAGKPLITSDTKMLKNYFKKGTVFVDNTANGIVDGIEKLKNDYDFFSMEILQFQEDRRNNFANKLNEVKEYLGLK